MGHQDKIDLALVSEPTWLKEVSPTSCMNLRDLADIFKVKTGTMRAKVVRGEFPPPDVTHIQGNTLFEGYSFCNKGQWRISTVRQFFKQHGETK